MSDHQNSEEMYRRAISRFIFDMDYLLELPQDLRERKVLDVGVPLRRPLLDGLLVRANSRQRLKLGFPRPENAQA